MNRNDYTTAPRTRLLIADDDAGFRDDFSRLLSMHSYECISVGDAASALKVVRQEPVDALISDVQMPGNFRLELVRAAQELRAGLPTFLLIDPAGGETPAGEVTVSVDGYFPKPPELGYLVPLIEQSVTRYRSHLPFDSGAPALAPGDPGLALPWGPPGFDLQSFGATLRKMATHLNQLADCNDTFPNRDLTQAELQRDQLAAAVKLTINVLEKTRKNFKSKELGELRKHLTHILQQQGAVP